MTSSECRRVARRLVGVCLAAGFTALLAMAQGEILVAHAIQRPPGGMAPATMSPGQRTPLERLRHEDDGKSLETAEKNLKAMRFRKADLPPVKRSEIKCAVFHWDPQLPKPAIVLVCPPREIFSPVHVYLKFTWRALEDIPKNFSKIVASAGSQTKLKPTKQEMRVLLKVSDTGDENGGTKWISFNQLDGVALEGE